MLDHLSIQCADVAASATFYDAALAPLGGRRVMGFGEVIGCGVPPRPEFWIGSWTTGEGFRQRNIAFVHPTGLPCGHSSTAVSVDAEVLHEPRVWPEYHPGYYGAFVRDPTATTPKPFATTTRRPRTADARRPTLTSTVRKCGDVGLAPAQRQRLPRVRGWITSTSAASSPVDHPPRHLAR